MFANELITHQNISVEQHWFLTATETILVWRRSQVGEEKQLT